MSGRSGRPPSPSPGRQFAGGICVRPIDRSSPDGARRARAHRYPDERRRRSPRPRPLLHVRADGHRAAEQKEGEERQDRDHVENALDDDRREGRGRVEALRTREQVRAQDFADASGQQERRGEPDDGRAKRDAEPRMAEGRQQYLPAPRADEIRLEGHEHGGCDEPEPGRGASPPAPRRRGRSGRTTTSAPA